MSSSSSATERCKLVFLASSLNRGGAERQLSVLARGLHRDGYDVKVITFYDGGRIWDI